jgi:hypothetical protein
MDKEDEMASALQYFIAADSCSRIFSRKDGTSAKFDVYANVNIL